MLATSIESRISFILIHLLLSLRIGWFLQSDFSVSHLALHEMLLIVHGDISP
jgi:hypothetical protein